MAQYTPPAPMKQIGDLFAVHVKRLRAPQSSVEKMVIVVVSEVCGYTLTTQQVSYTVATKTIYLHAPAILRTEVLSHREVIITELKKQLGEEYAPHTIL